MAPRKWYAILDKELARYGISKVEHQSSPIYLFQKSKSFRQYIYGIHKIDELITWYNKPMRWRDILKEHPSAQIIAAQENVQWISKY